MASIKFTTNQMLVHAQNSVYGLAEMIGELKNDEFDYISFDCKLKSIERDIESLRRVLDDYEEEE